MLNSIKNSLTYYYYGEDVYNQQLKLDNYRKTHLKPLTNQEKNKILTSKENVRELLKLDEEGYNIVDSNLQPSVFSTVVRMFPDEDVISLLLDNGADVTEIPRYDNRNRNDLLMFYCMHEDISLDIIRKMVVCGISPSYISYEGVNALFIYCSHNPDPQVEVIRYFAESSDVTDNTPTPNTMINSFSLSNLLTPQNIDGWSYLFPAPNFESNYPPASMINVTSYSSFPYSTLAKYCDREDAKAHIIQILLELGASSGMIWTKKMISNLKSQNVENISKILNGLNYVTPLVLFVAQFHKYSMSDRDLELCFDLLITRCIEDHDKYHTNSCFGNVDYNLKRIPSHSHSHPHSQSHSHSHSHSHSYSHSSSHSHSHQLNTLDTPDTSDTNTSTGNISENTYTLMNEEDSLVIVDKPVCCILATACENYLTQGYKQVNTNILLKFLSCGLDPTLMLMQYCNRVVGRGLGLGHAGGEVDFSIVQTLIDHNASVNVFWDETHPNNHGDGLCSPLMSYCSRADKLDLNVVKLLTYGVDDGNYILVDDYSFNSDLIINNPQYSYCPDADVYKIGQDILNFTNSNGFTSFSKYLTSRYSVHLCLHLYDLNKENHHIFPFDMRIVSFLMSDCYSRMLNTDTTGTKNTDMGDISIENTNSDHLSNSPSQHVDSVNTTHVKCVESNENNQIDKNHSPNIFPTITKYSANEYVLNQHYNSGVTPLQYLVSKYKNIHHQRQSTYLDTFDVISYNMVNTARTISFMIDSGVNINQLFTINKTPSSLTVSSDFENDVVSNEYQGTLLMALYSRYLEGIFNLNDLYIVVVSLHERIKLYYPPSTRNNIVSCVNTPVINNVSNHLPNNNIHIDLPVLNSSNIFIDIYHTYNGLSLLMYLVSHQLDLDKCFKNSSNSDNNVIQMTDKNDRAIQLILEYIIHVIHKSL